ncbi:MAG: hypothetical protein ACI8X5_001583 [Planctomycetota bacterium]|jgi:hypothetical protein
MNAYPTRTIAYICELFHAPLPIATDSVQRIHNRYFEEGSPPYSSFAVTPAGPVLSNPGLRPGVISQVVFLPDRIQFREELGAMTAEDFGARVHKIADDSAQERSLEGYAGQRITIRTLVNPRKFDQSIDYMRDGLLGFGDMIDVFEATPQIYGLRMEFPAGPESRTTNSLRIENYFQDKRTLYMENQSASGPVRVMDQLSQLEENVASAYDFLVQKASSFVQAFDLRLEE